MGFLGNGWRLIKKLEVFHTFYEKGMYKGILLLDHHHDLNLYCIYTRHGGRVVKATELYTNGTYHTGSRPRWSTFV